METRIPLEARARRVITILLNGVNIPDLFENQVYPIAMSISYEIGYYYPPTKGIVGEVTIGEIIRRLEDMSEEEYITFIMRYAFVGMPL